MYTSRGTETTEQWCHPQTEENEHWRYKTSTGAHGATNGNAPASLKTCGNTEPFLTYMTNDWRSFLHIENPIPSTLKIGLGPNIYGSKTPTKFS